MIFFVWPVFFCTHLCVRRTHRSRTFLSRVPSMPMRSKKPLQFVAATVFALRCRSEIGLFPACRAPATGFVFPLCGAEAGSDPAQKVPNCCAWGALREGFGGNSPPVAAWVPPRAGAFRNSSTPLSAKRRSGATIRHFLCAGGEFCGCGRSRIGPPARPRRLAGPSWLPQTPRRALCAEGIADVRETKDTRPALQLRSGGGVPHEKRRQRNCSKNALEEAYCSFCT